MSKRFLSVFYITAILILILPSCSTKNSANQAGKDNKPLEERTTQPEQPNVNKIITDAKEKTVESKQLHTDKKETDLKTDIPKPKSSGVTTDVPWKNDNNFKAAQEKNGTFELMAAYQTVLQDPLPGEEYNVHLAARLLAGTIVYPELVFSQNQIIGPYTEDKGFQKGPTYIGTELKTTVGGGVCKLASTLYNVAILSNLQVTERHPHSMPVPYVPYGQDATVSYGSNDFKFRNNTKFPVLIWAQGIDNTLYVGFYGTNKPPEVVWHHQTLKTNKAPTVYKTNGSLPANTEKLVNQGMDGANVKSWVSIKNPDGNETIKQLGVSYYRPMPNIIEKNE